jgi:hypothetical protein
MKAVPSKMMVNESNFNHKINKNREWKILSSIVISIEVWSKISN